MSHTVLFLVIGIALATTALLLVSSFAPLARPVSRQRFVKITLALMLVCALVFAWHVALIAFDTGATFQYRNPDNVILQFNPITNVISITYTSAAAEARRPGEAVLLNMLEYSFNFERMRRLDLYAWLVPYRVQVDDLGPVVLP